MVGSLSGAASNGSVSSNLAKSPRSSNTDLMSASVLIGFPSSPGSASPGGASSSFPVADLTVDVAANFPKFVYGDPNRLRQVLINLMGNAIKFTQAGEVAVRISLDSDSKESAMVRFEVKDTGIGIQAETWDHIFQPFNQAEAGTGRKFGGTGLGLAITKQLAEQMGGEVGLESEPGMGSTFWFTVQLEKQASTAVVSPGMVDFSNLRALLIEDCAEQASCVGDMLGTWNLETTVVTSAADGLAMLSEQEDGTDRYGLILLDEDVHDFDASLFSDTIRANAALGGVPIILFGPLRHEGQNRALLESAHSVRIEKPLRQSALLNGLLQAMALDGLLLGYCVEKLQFLETPIFR